VSLTDLLLFAVILASVAALDSERAR